jgi:hypothetical protein
MPMGRENVAARGFSPDWRIKVRRWSGRKGRRDDVRRHNLAKRTRRPAEAFPKGRARTNRDSVREALTG